jgi:hypothetical protein
MSIWQKVSLLMTVLEDLKVTPPRRLVGTSALAGGGKEKEIICPSTIPRMRLTSSHMPLYALI